MLLRKCELRARELCEIHIFVQKRTIDFYVGLCYNAYDCLE